MVKPSVCDICGFKIVGDQNFCSGCGVDLREPKGPESEKKNVSKRGRKKKQPTIQQEEKSPEDELRIVKWCWLKTWEMPHCLILLSLLAQGKSELGFCGCPICNQGYRELLAFIENLSGKNLNSHSREIVNKAREADISELTMDISDLLLNFPHKGNEKTRKSQVSTPVRDTAISDGKIFVEIDESVIENAVIKVLQSERGQQIIQDCKPPRKKRTIIKD